MSETERENGGGLLAGVDIGGTKTAVVLSEEPPAILERVEFPTLPEEGPERAIDLIRKHLRQFLAARERPALRLRAIGVSCGSPLDRISGVIQAPPNLPTWRDVPITSMLGEEFGVPCRLENDANAGAVAEHRFGAGRGTQHMVFITMGTGFGAGIIADGRLYHGASDSAGEIGHVRLTPDGPVGYHKAGSVEGWISGSGIAQVGMRELTEAKGRGEVTTLSACVENGGKLTARDIVQAAQQGDALAKRIVEQTAERLGQALALIADILNPERVVIGGLAMRMGEMLLTPARAAMQREALASSYGSCTVVPAALGEQIGDLAAICVAMGF